MRAKWIFFYAWHGNSFLAFCKLSLAPHQFPRIILPMSKPSNTRQSVSEIIAARFVADFNKGVAPWARGFNVIAPINLVSKRAYRGVNLFLLSMLGVDAALTYKQAQALGGQVKKGAKGIPVVFWNFPKKNEVTGEKEGVPFMRYYTVFNVADVDGVDFQPWHNAHLAKIETAETLFNEIREKAGFTLKDGGNQPCFIPASNEIQMPTFERWNSNVRFYKTLFHECGHALGKVTGKTFGFHGESYATEELVAELFASVCLSKLGINSPDAWDNSVAYVQGWASKLGSDPQVIISAAQECQKRVDLVFGTVNNEESAE